MVSDRNSCQRYEIEIALYILHMIFKYCASCSGALSSDTIASSGSSVLSSYFEKEIETHGFKESVCRWELLPPCSGQASLVRARISSGATSSSKRISAANFQLAPNLREPSKLYKKVLLSRSKIVPVLHNGTNKGTNGNLWQSRLYWWQCHPRWLVLGRDLRGH